MAKSIYGFAQSVESSGSGVTTALRLYQRAIAQGAGEAGVIENPDIYRQARDAYLAPLADDVRVSTKIAESINDENRLRDKKNDVDLATSVFKEQVNDILKTYAQSYYQSPSNLVMTTAFVYNTAVDELGAEIESRRAAGQGIGDMQSLMSDYSSKADKMSRLARQVMANGKPQNPNGYGWFIKTNPDDGSIISLELDGVDSTDKASGYTRTAQYYGDIPVWTNTVVDEKGKTVARIGQNKYELQDNENGKILKNIGKQYGGFFKGYLPGGKSPDEVRELNRNINLGGIEFGNVLRLPTGSVAKDAAGNYYYYGADGVYKAPNKENLSKFLNNTGTPIGDVDSSAFPISQSEVKSFGSFIDDNGKSRIIDDKLLGGFASPAPISSPNLPPLDQVVKGTFSTSPLPGISMPDANANSTTAFQVPRKQPGVKEQSQVGTPTTEDTMNNQAVKYGAGAKPFANIFGKK